MAATQLGTELKIGFGTFALTGYIPEDGLTWTNPFGNKEEITDAVGDMETKIFMDARNEFTMSLIILDATGSITPPAEGATVTLIPPSGLSTTYMCTSGSVAFARGHTVLTLSLVGEASMSYI